MVYISNSPEDTANLAERLAKAAGPGAVFCLKGELGAGKTVFAQGFAKGLGVKEDVVSPTFCLLNVYESGRTPFYHFDVYRIDNPAQMDELCYPDFFYGCGICLIEWAGNIKDIVPDNAVWVCINIKPDGAREIDISGFMED